MHHPHRFDHFVQKLSARLRADARDIITTTQLADMLISCLEEASRKERGSAVAVAPRGERGAKP